MTLEDYATNVDMRVHLREPFPQRMVQTIQKHGHSEDYVSHAAVTDRLNAEAPGWFNSQPEFIWDEQNHIVGVVCSLTIGNVTRWEVGDAGGKSDPGDEAKKAMSDWIKRAAMRFGVALDLWSKVELERSAQVAAGAAPGESTVATTKGRVTSSPSEPRDAQAGTDGGMPQPASPPPSTGAGEGSVGTTGAPAGSSGEAQPAGVSHYLNKDDQALLKGEWGGQKNALDAYRSVFPNVSRLADITYEMRDKMNEGAVSA